MLQVGPIGLELSYLERSINYMYEKLTRTLLN